MNRVLIGISVLGLFGTSVTLDERAFAQDLGLDASVSAGPASVDVSVGVSGTNATAEASGGLGSTGAGASTSAGTDGVSAAAEATAGSGATGTAGVSASAEVGTDVSPASGASMGQNTSGTATPSTAAGRSSDDPKRSTMAVPKSAAAPARARLPEELVPRKDCDAGAEDCAPDRPSDREVDHRTPQYRAAMAALGRVAGVPVGTVTACRKGIIKGAMPYDPVRIDAVSAGNVQRIKGGGEIAPLMVRIVYDREGGYEIREAKVNCQLNGQGAVVALS